MSDLDKALFNYSRRLDSWLSENTIDNVDYVEELQPLTPGQKAGFTYLLQCNVEGLLVDGDPGPQVRLALVERGLLSDDWQPQENRLITDNGHGPRKLTPDDYRHAAAKLRVSEARLRALVEVEAAGGGYFTNGEPKILFEGHIFWYRLRQAGIDPAQVAAQHPSIAYKNWTKKHYLGGIREYERLAIAASYDREAAYGSCSYGLFQIVAHFHARTMGYSSSVAMYEAYKNGTELLMLEDFIRLAESNGWAKLLRSGNIRGFVRAYNGPGQVDFYSQKFVTAENKWKVKL